ncbi:MAG: YraN family protein [Candidatus Babeliales bacterium]|jgi:putative endonuclease
MQKTAILGAQGEALVASWLERQGFTIIARNYQTRCGEVDIIAARDEVVAFVEVKTRQHEYFPISQAVTWPKQQRIIKAAQYFIISKQLRDKVFRFDVATVIFQPEKHQIEYIENAFQRRF